MNNTQHNVKLGIDRHEPQGGLDVALKRLRFCLDQLEKRGFAKGFDMETSISKRLTLEEIIGALVASEQVIMEWTKEGLNT